MTPPRSTTSRSCSTRMPNGTVRFDGGEHIVMGGTGDADRMRAGDGDDTLWGDGGGDRLEGGAGNDALNGNDGDDVITDLFGDDNIKGGDGDDAINAGGGFDLILSGFGDDFVVAGSDPKETFGGGGDDFDRRRRLVRHGLRQRGRRLDRGRRPGRPAAGRQRRPVPGRHPDRPRRHHRRRRQRRLRLRGRRRHHGHRPRDRAQRGHARVRLGHPQGRPAAGGRGHGLHGPPAARTRTTSATASTTSRACRAGSTATCCAATACRVDEQAGNELATAEQIARIDGLRDLLGPDATGFTGGNIILGGAGSDLIEGRGGNDLIDGDAWLDVQLEVPDGQGGMRARRRHGGQLQADVFAGRIDPGEVRIVRRDPDGRGAGHRHRRVLRRARRLHRRARDGEPEAADRRPRGRDAARRHGRPAQRGAAEVRRPHGRGGRHPDQHAGHRHGPRSATSRPPRGRR